MYEVFSTTRTGRPGWALVATAILFVLTTIAAALMARHKSKSAEIILGESKAYSALGLQASFPAGWEVGEVGRVAQGQMIIASGAEDGVERHLLVFRVQVPIAGRGHVARMRSVQMATEGVLRSVDPRARIGRPQHESLANIGSMPSEIYVFGMDSSLGNDIQTAIANVAMASDRQIVGALLVVDGRPVRRDWRLLQKFSDSISAQAGRTAPQPGGDLDVPAGEPEDYDPADPKPMVESHETGGVARAAPAV